MSDDGSAVKMRTSSAKKCISVAFLYECHARELLLVGNGTEVPQQVKIAGG